MHDEQKESMKQVINWRKYGEEQPPNGTSVLFFTTKHPNGPFGAFGIVKWEEYIFLSNDLKVFSKHKNNELREIDSNDIDFWIPLKELLSLPEVMKEVYCLNDEQIKIYQDDHSYEEI